jgi:hypothetical protein
MTENEPSLSSRSQPYDLDITQYLLEASSRSQPYDLDITQYLLEASSRSQPNDLDICLRGWRNNLMEYPSVF